MALEITISKNTTIPDINNNWSPNKGNEVVFKITKQSSFQVFTEGLALGCLRDFELKSVSIFVELYQTPVYDHNNENLPPILTTIFGLELLYLCQKVYVRGEENDIDLRDSLGRYIWGNVLRHKGAISSGKLTYLLSRHGYEVPQCLREPTSLGFPRLDYFQNRISNFIVKMRGSGNKIGHAERRLIEWLHQIGENAHEHGSVLIEENGDLPIKGFRGIILQKLIFNKNKSVEVRKDLPDIARKFIRKCIENSTTPESEIIINIATVVDLGMGIQNTLFFPDAKRPSHVRLNTAFKDGITRKKIEYREDSAGYGLGQAVNAAKHLGALLYIISADVVSFQDLSERCDSQGKTSENINLVKLEESNKHSGTSISIMWLQKPQVD